MKSMAEEKMILTQDGIEKLKAEYRRLIDVDRPDVIEALKAARAQGDLSENADYDAARDRQAKIESRITEIEHIMEQLYTLDYEILSGHQDPEFAFSLFLANFSL